MSDYSYHGSVVVTVGHHSALDPVAVFTHLELADAWVRQHLADVSEDIVAWPVAINPPEQTLPDDVPSGVCWAWEARGWVEYRDGGPWNGRRVTP